MSNYWLLLIPVISAIIGWSGTWLAGKIFVYRIIPQKQKDISQDIAISVSTAFSFDDLEKKITDPETIKKVMPVVEEHVDDFLRNKLKQKIPMIGMLIGDKTINSLKEIFLTEIGELFPHVLKNFAGNLKNDLNIEAEVFKKVNTIKPADIEKRMLPLLRYFQLSGAILGLIIGITNIAIFLMVK